ncbi:site-2 protease family protein [Hyphococcus sp.]|uniref:site-2 protease family protein n=1 Tax=Hyphococcus sp. TaxID=2038636 RepID=UPI0035C67EBF
MNLGLINLLPIPIFDGGHLAFVAIEAIKRRPISIRTREIATLVGFVLIAAMIILARQKIGVSEPRLGGFFRAGKRAQQVFGFRCFVKRNQTAGDFDLRLLVKGRGFRNVPQHGDGFFIVAISVEDRACEALRMIEIGREIKRDAREGERHVVIGVADAKAGFLRRFALFDGLLQDRRPKGVERNGRAFLRRHIRPGLVGLARFNALKPELGDLTVGPRILRQQFVMVASALYIAGALKKRTIGVARHDAAIRHQGKLIGGSRLVLETGVFEQKRLMQGMKAAEGLTVLCRQRLQRSFRALFTGKRPRVENNHGGGEIFNLRIGGEGRAGGSVILVLERIGRLDKPCEIVILGVVIREDLRRELGRLVDVAGSDTEKERAAQDFIAVRTGVLDTAKGVRRHAHIIAPRGDAARQIIADHIALLGRCSTSGEGETKTE